MSARALSLLFLLAGLAVTARASAQAPLVSVPGAGTLGYGTSCLSYNDDGSSASIDITGAFPGGLRFFSGTYTTMFVDTNGNISFYGAEPTFTPAAFPRTGQPMIAPYWADVDIRQHGTCMGGVGTSSSGSGPCLNPPTNDVWWYMEPGRIIVTWFEVGYYTCHNNHRMSFQLILTANMGTCGSSGLGSGNFDVEFRYNRCEWETGDASGGTGGFGGTPAQAGFDAGDGVNFVSLPLSRMPGIAANLCSSSNVTPAIPGVWRFGVRGGVVMCPGAGADCTIPGAMGVCAAGRTQCVGSGTSCQPVNTMSAETCDALDNDCNGMVDDGDICPPMQVCDHGSCVPRCFEGSCATGQTCTTAGICVDTACTTVTCPADQRCVAGTCVAACDGITCPLGQQCRLGHCVDACAGVMCDMDSVCEAGVCQPMCPCRTCATGQECTTDGRCVDTGCAAMTCDPGTVCVAGACVDACTGAVCPSGTTCMGGSCMDLPDAGPPDGGWMPPDLGPGADAGAIDDAGTIDDAGGIDAGTCVGDGSRSAGCHGVHKSGCCNVAGTRDTSAERAGGLALCALAVVAAARRRRRVR